MTGIQESFERVEKKLILTAAQADDLMQDLTAKMVLDQYGQHTIRNLYYDTADDALIRASIQKPVYKAKFRLRAYGTPQTDTLIFAELKKKYRGIVYKRRIAAAPEQLRKFMDGETLPDADGQIQRELHRFLQEHPIAPRVFLAYERVALYGREDPALRMTFDTNLRFRTDRLSDFTDATGGLICPENPVIMEIKLMQAAPLWLSRMLSRHHLYISSFSKYGTCYQNHLIRPVRPVQPVRPEIPLKTEGVCEHAS